MNNADNWNIENNVKISQQLPTNWIIAYIHDLGRVTCIYEVQFTRFKC